MGGLLVLYYAVCYSIGGAALIVSLIAARSKASPPDARFAVFSLSLALMLVPFSVLSYTGANIRLKALVFALWFVVAAGEALMIASLPRFMHSLLPSKRQGAIEAMWTASAAVAFGCQPLALLFPTAAAFLLVVPMVLMPAAILYVSVVFVARGLRDRGWKAGMGEAELARWKSVIKAVTAISAISLPFLLVIDFFPESLVGLRLGLPPFFKVFPLVYAAFGIVYLATTLPLLLRPAAALATEAASEPLDGSGLSAREAEVARLLLAGLRYKEIGARLYISLSTVKTHVERIYRKTGARNKMELARKLR